MADDFKGSKCFAAAAQAAKAAGEELSERDMAAAYRAAQQERQRLRDAGVTDGVDEKVAAAADRLAERTRIAAALQKRHAALNILVRDRLDETLTAFKAAGMSPRDAMLAVFEGSQQGIKGARNSVYARQLGYEARYVGGMMAEIQKNAPHLVNVLSDKRLSDDVFREMGELREGGTPGATGNKDAQYLAEVFSKYAEMSRTELNRLGASIGKLDGWAGAQVHDDMKMLAAGKETWVDTIAPLLDVSRTFPDASGPAEIREILGDVYDTIITGVPNKVSGKEKGQRVNPANLAKSLGKSRVMHFRDAESSLAYRDAFGYGNSIYGVMAHQRRASQMAAQMEVFGPNPEIMFNSIVEAERRRIRNDDSLTPDQKVKDIQKLNSDAGPLRGAFDVMSGAISRPGNIKAAKIAGDIRAVQSMSKLGGAVMTAMPTDVIGAAQASMFRGSGFFNGMVEQLSGIFKGRPKQEQAELSFMLGEGFDSLIGEVMSRGMASDGPVGKLSRMQETFFKWNGLNWWTDVGRSVVGRSVAAEMGMRASAAFADLPANYRHVLGLHGIDEGQWNVIRQASRDIDGKRYITPDAVRDLPDEAIASLTEGKIKQATEAATARQQSLQAKVAQEDTWVQGRKAKLDEWFGTATARLSELKSTVSERTGAKSSALRSQIDVLDSKLSDLQEFYDIGRGSERTVARQEMQVEQRIARGKKSLSAVSAWLDEAKGGVDERTATLIRNTVAQLDELEAAAGGKIDPAAASAKFEDLQSRIQKAIDDSEARMSSLDKAAQTRSADITAKLDDLSTSLEDIRSAYPVTKGQARKVGRDEGRAVAKQKEISRRIKALERNATAQQKEAFSKFYKDWAARQVDLEEFAKRSQDRASMFQQMSDREATALPDKVASIMDDTRRELETTLLRFVADETNYAIVETDSASRRVSTWNAKRPGTIAGEVARFVMQFKGFPIAFSQRVLGRALFGGQGATKWERVMNNAPHLGALIGGLTVAGYMAMTMKDAAKGYWPPRNPMDPKVITAALTQGGALGIYGDFLFGEANRFGSGALETFSGPFIGTISDIVNIPLKARGAIEKGEKPKMAGDLLNLALGNTPFINLAYTRPALDVLFINSLKNWASPGYTNRQRKQRFKDYGQTSPLPATLSEALR